MDPMARWVLAHPLGRLSEAGRRAAFDQHFGATQPGTYQSAVSEAHRLRASQRAIERGPAAARLDTAMGLGARPQDEVRIPVVIQATTRGTGHTFTRRIDVVLRGGVRVGSARAEVNAQAVDSADDSAADVDAIIYLPGAYYGPAQGYDYP